MRLLLVLLLAILGSASPHGGVREQLQENYGYVEVRPGAHMFWVMYHVDQPGDYTEFPLVMWLQGGPGASGVGYGNFMELGPYDINGNLREYAWTKKANVLFVDNPVGTGYSYVEDYSQLTTDNAQIAEDLVNLIKSVFSANKDMQVMPFYVFAESYGGKMTADFALSFDKAIKNGEVVSDFRGVALGDSWISPMDSVNTWGTFLYQMGIVNRAGLVAIDEAASLTQAAVDSGDWEIATNLWSYTEGVVLEVGNNVDFYNVLAKDDIYRDKSVSNKTDLSHMRQPVRDLYVRHRQTRDALGDFMTGPQADQWGIPDNVEWDSQGSYVFSSLSGDFMKPVIDSVVKLLTETDLHVAVFTGNLDLICDTPGTYRWIENMEWPGKPAFMDANNTPIYITSYSSNAGTIQAAGQFSVYTILRSGHMVPIDAPEMAHKMLDMIFASTKEKTSKQETPKQEALKQETPKQEEAKQETAIKQEASKLEAPKPEAPKQETAIKQEASKLQAPKNEALKQEAPKLEEKYEQQEQKKEEHVRKEKSNQEEHKQEKATKQKPPKEEEHKQKAPKQENASKKEQKQKTPGETPKQEKVSKKEQKQKTPKEASNQEGQKQENASKKEQKQKTPKEASKQEGHKQQEAPKKPQKQEKEPKQKKTLKQEEQEQESQKSKESQKQETYQEREMRKEETYKQMDGVKQEKYNQKEGGKQKNYKQKKGVKQEKSNQKEGNKQEKQNQKEGVKQEKYNQKDGGKQENYKQKKGVKLEKHSQKEGGKQDKYIQKEESRQENYKQKKGVKQESYKQEKGGKQEKYSQKKGGK